MLVLSRRRDEKIVVKVPPGVEGEIEIEVTVVQIDQNRVRLGFVAPNEVIILRSELAERKTVQPVEDHVK